MPICIICREEKTEFSDEHVIPDSLGGYYHIYTVCKDCNGRLGSFVDSKLVNHKLMEFQRNQLGIRGKKGQLPNPFSGVGFLQDDPTQKMRLDMDKEGNFIPRFLPKVPEFQPGSKTYQFTIDKKDLGLKDEIIDKLLKRNGLDRSQINFHQEVERASRPWIESKMQIDIKDFRIGMLKVAYEFTVDCLPKYLDDETGKIIANILLHADLEDMDKKVKFLGNGFNKEILRPFAHLIDFDNDNHYLVLIESEGIGLICQVNLFHSFAIAIQMSISAQYLNHDVKIGINDIEKHSFEKIFIDQLIRRTWAPNEYGFQYWFPTQEEANEFVAFQEHPEFDFSLVNGKIPFYDRYGNIKYGNIDGKLSQPQLVHYCEGDDIDDMITKIDLDEELFIKLNPGMRLFQVTAVRNIQKRIGKI